MEITQTTVQETLNTEDIEGLLELGAPGDEYSHEAEGITSALADLPEKELTEEKLASVVRGVWIRSFGPFSDVDIEKRSPAFKQVAHKILTAHP
ncbi:MAG TPA: hypothetical protein VGD59_13360 [Acidisarcina sp.]